MNAKPAKCGLLSVLGAMLSLLGTGTLAQSVQWSAVAFGSGNGTSTPGSYELRQGKRAIKADAAGNLFVTGRLNTPTSADMRTVKYTAATGAVAWQALLNGPGNGEDVGNAVALDPAGNPVTAGYVTAAGSTLLKVVKYSNATGAVMWEAAPLDGAAQAVAIDAAGNVFLTGITSDGGGGVRLRALKLSGTDGSLVWERTFAGAGTYDEGVDIALDSAGDAIVIGRTYSAATLFDRIIIKYRGSDGVTLWGRGYNGSVNNDDDAYALALDAAGNAVVTGAATTANAREIKTMKYDGTSGALLWEASYSPPGSPVNEGNAVAVDAAGNVFVSGSTVVSSNYQAVTIKYAAATGAQLWQTVAAFPGGSNAFAVAIDAAGNPVVTGQRTNAAGYDYRTTKFDGASGALIWARDYGSEFQYEQALAIVLDVAGNALVAGRAFTEADFDFLPIKYAAADGATLWEGGTRTLRQRMTMRPGTFGRTTLARDLDGNAIVAGLSFNGTNTDFRTVKYSATTGAVLWEKTYGGLLNQDDIPYAVGVDAAGNVTVAGSIGNNGATAFVSVRYAAADGAKLFEHIYLGTGLANDRALAIAADSSGNVFVAGSVFSPGGDADFKIFKLGARSVLWEKAIVTAGYDEAIALAVDPAGNVVATGFHQKPMDSDARTLKLAAADGATLWDVSYNGPANSDDRATGIAVDGAGDIFVTGYSWNGANFDYFTIKYLGGTGALGWSRVLNGGSDDQAYAIALDPSGNPVVTGSSWNGTNYDFRTVKYAGFDGRVRWDKSYNGAANGDDIAYAVAVDAAGNAVVAGSSFNGANLDFKVVKLAAADGTLMWESTVNGAWNGNDSALAVVTVPGAVYIAGNCVEKDYYAVCTVRIDDSGVLAAGDSNTDFNADGVNDIVWKHADGRTALWLMHGPSQVGGASLLPAASGWTPRLIADFNGDGQADIVWQHADGRVAMWLMNGATQVGGAILMPAGSGWSPVLAGDFDGSGRAGILWQERSGRTAIWLMNGTTQIGGRGLFGPQTGWEPRFVADFNGDGNADILWVHRDGRVAIWLMAGEQQLAGAVIMGPTLGWIPKLVGDFNGDGRSDILWQHNDGRTAMWLMDGTAQIGGRALFGAGSGWHMTRVADTNGDGRDDIVWQHEDGRIAVWLMDGTTQVGGGILSAAGSGWSVKRAVDFTREGRDDFVVQHADGTLAMWLMNGTAYTSTTLLKAGSGWSTAP